MLLGREPELRAIDRVLADARLGRSAALVIRGEAGIGNGVVSIAVAPNTTGLKRKGRMTIAGQVFTVTQKG